MHARTLFLFSLVAAVVLTATGLWAIAAVLGVAAFALFLCHLSAEVDSLRETLGRMREWPQCPCKPQIEEIRDAVTKLAASSPASGDEAADEQA